MSTNEHKPFEIRLDQEMTINTICRNLVAAGILLPEEVDRYKGVLAKYDPLTLVKVLLESHLLREAHEEAQQ
ncbi:hypothetical protein ES705_16955 [subsurface metagenome]